MQTKHKRRGGGAALLAAAGMLTALLATGADAARHHARHSVRHYAHRSVRHYLRVASAGGGEAYGEGIEHALAGVHIDDSYRTVLQRFGNPSETQLEEIELVPVAATGTTGASSPVGEAPNGGVAAVQTTPVKIFVGPSSPEPGAAAGGTTGSPSGSGLAGALSGAIGALGNGSLFQSMGGFPSGGSSPGVGGAAGAAGATSIIKPEHPEYRWIYDEPNSNSLEFTFSPGGSVIQIRATGYHGFVRTNRGIELGVKFSQVLLAYGNPEKQNYDGPILSANYTDRSHVGFQFYNQRLVGITVASVE